tara:strand:- start:39 stop:176 length:138 start_codon:yes stop_codon:yes gene_type:complete
MRSDNEKLIYKVNLNPDGVELSNLSDLSRKKGKEKPSQWITILSN